MNTLIKFKSGNYDVELLNHKFFLSKSDEDDSVIPMSKNYIVLKHANSGEELKFGVNRRLGLTSFTDWRCKKKVKIEKLFKAPEYRNFDAGKSTSYSPKGMIQELSRLIGNKTIATKIVGVFLYK